MGIEDEDVLDRLDWMHSSCFLLLLPLDVAERFLLIALGGSNLMVSNVILSGKWNSISTKDARMLTKVSDMVYSSLQIVSTH